MNDYITIKIAESILSAISGLKSPWKFTWKTFGGTIIYANQKPQYIKYVGQYSYYHIEFDIGTVIKILGESWVSVIELDEDTVQTAVNYNYI